MTQTATIVAQTPKLPAGTYVINASIDMFTDGQSIYCFDAVAGDRLHHSGTLAQTLAEGGSGSAIVTLALTDAATVPSGTRLAYYCASNGDNVSTSDEEITAIPVNAITTNS